MCVVSLVSDHYQEKYKDKYNDLWRQSQVSSLDTLQTRWQSYATKVEFDALKKDVEEMKKLLERAVKYDEVNNEPECHMDEKVALLKKIAELVGVDLSSVFK